MANRSTFSSVEPFCLDTEGRFMVYMEHIHFFLEANEGQVPVFLSCIKSVGLVGALEVLAASEALAVLETLIGPLVSLVKVETLRNPGP